MNIIFVKSGNNVSYGNAKQIAGLVGVHKNTISRWIMAGDRIVFKNGFEIYLKPERL